MHYYVSRVLGVYVYVADKCFVEGGRVTLQRILMLPEPSTIPGGVLPPGVYVTQLYTPFQE